MTSVFNFQKSKLGLIIFATFFLLVPFLLPTPSYAATLTPGALFTSCGTIAAAGVYYLNANISTTSATCINITSAGATIYSTTTYSISQAIIATSTGTAVGYSFTLGGGVQVNGTINALGSGGQGAGTVTFASTTSNHGTVIANAIFNNSAYTYATSTLTASTTVFNNTSYNLGTVNASSTTFNNTSWNNGTTTATTTFTGNVYSYNSAATSTSPDLGVVTSGIILFTPATGSSTVTFNVGTASTSNACSSTRCLWSTNTATWNFGTDTPVFNFYGNALNATTTALNIASTGLAYFYDTSSNIGTTTANKVVFSGTSYNIGVVTASSTTFNNTTYNNGVVVGNATFNNSAYNASTGWTQTSAPSEGWQSITSSADGTHLAAAVYVGYIYVSANSGSSWTQTSAPSEGWQSITSSADGTHLAAAPYYGYIYTSTNSGSTWVHQTTLTGYWQSITSSADGTHLAAADLGDGYIYVSANSGSSWTQTSAPNQNWCSITSSADGTHLAAAVCGGYIYVSANSGSSWTQTSAPSEGWSSITSSADGTHLAAAVNGGYIYVSANSGSSWTQTSAPNQNWNSITSSSYGNRLAAANIDSIYTTAFGVVTGNATFNGSSYNQGTVTGNSTFTGANTYSWNSTLSSFTPQAGNVGGNTIFTPTSGSTLTFNIGTASTTEACSSAQCIWNTDTSNWSFGTSTPTFNFYGDAENEGNLSIGSGLSNFYDSSFNIGTTTVSVATFTGTSNNADNSGNKGVVVGNANVYPPVSNPLGGTVTGTTSYIGYLFGTYFNDKNTNDGDWGDLANWWTDASATIPANYYPAASSTVYIQDPLTANSLQNGAQAEQVVFENNTYDSFVSIEAATTSFNGNSYNEAYINGNVIFNDQSYNNYLVSGDAVFNDQSYNDGTVEDNALFTGSTYSIDPTDANGSGNISGQVTLAPIGTSTVTFNIGTPGDDSNTYTWYSDTSTWNYGSSTLVWNFYGETSDNGVLEGNATFNDETYNDNGFIDGNAIFNDASYNEDTRPGGEEDISGNAIFNGSSSNNTANIGGNATFNGASYDDGSTIGGNMIINTTWYDNASSTVPTNGVLRISGNIGWYTNVTGTVYDSQGNIITDYVFSGNASNYAQINGNAAFSGDNYISNNSEITGSATFSGNSSNQDIVDGDATFNNDAQNSGGGVGGTAIFNDQSSNQYGEVEGDATFNDQAYNTSGHFYGDMIFTGSEYSIAENDIDPTGGYNTYLTGQIFFEPIGTSTVTFNVGTPGDDTNTYTWYSDASTWNYGSSTLVWNFYGASSVQGTVIHATFYDESWDNGVVLTQATFNDDSYSLGGDVGEFWENLTGTATFNDSSYNGGTVNGTATFNGNSSNTSYASGVLGNATFNDHSFNNYAYVSGNATFNDNSYDSFGYIGGNMTINTPWYDNDNNTLPVGGVLNITGSSTWTTDVAGTAYDSTGAPITLFVFGDSTLNLGVVPTDAVFNDDSSNSSILNYNGVVNGNAIFNNNSFNADGATVNDDATFNNNSYNASGGLVIDNATFTGSSGNNGGIVQGNASVYSPVSRPLGGTVDGITTYYNYGSLYFNTKNTGSGNWNNVNNWWTNASSTIAAGTIPHSYDNTVIQSPVTTTGTSTASVQTVTFTGTSTNGVTIATTNGATFQDSSTNNGTITGNALFDGDLTSDNGTVSGSVTREYVSNATTTRNFVTEGGTNHWTIIASNAVINIASSTHNSTDVFKALDNGQFIPSVTPHITISVPAAATTTSKWLPSVAWGTSATCEYSLDGGSYNTVTCSNNGSDIPRPTAGVHTLALEGTDSNGDITQISESFTYNNTSPIYTSCGDDLLDESRTYYLTGNVTGDCTILANNVTLKGAQSTTTIGYSVNGDIIADGTSTGANGFNITLDYLRVNGTVSANGADGSTNVNGGNGGSITIATSTTGNVSSTGGDPQQNGGNGGTITILNSLATSSALVIANGGDSGGCGYGGSGGNVNLLYSSGYTVSNSAGTGNSGGCSPTGSQGTSGGSQIVGSYGTQGVVSGGSSNTSPTSVPGQGVVTSAGSATPLPINAFPGALPSVTLPVNILSPLNLTPLPVFGTTTGSFNFNSPVTHFLFAPFPASLTKALAPYPELSSYLSSLNISSAQTLASLKHTAIHIATTTVPGLFSLESSSTPVKLSFSYSPTSYIIETGTVTAGAVLTVHLPTTSPVTLSFEGVTETMYGGYLTFNAPTIAGTYLLTSPSAPLPLSITVLAPPPQAPSSPGGWWGWVVNLFNW